MKLKRFLCNWYLIIDHFGWCDVMWYHHFFFGNFPGTFFRGIFFLKTEIFHFPIFHFEKKNRLNFCRLHSDKSLEKNPGETQKYFWKEQANFLNSKKFSNLFSIIIFLSIRATTAKKIDYEKIDFFDQNFFHPNRWIEPQGKKISFNQCWHAELDRESFQKFYRKFSKIQDFFSSSLFSY